MSFVSPEGSSIMPDAVARLPVSGERNPIANTLRERGRHMSGSRIRPPPMVRRKGARL